MKVGIIGGGAAGLAAAWKLVKGGHQVEVFERAPFLGGQASTFEVGGARLEKGYHHLFISDTYMVDLINELGLGGHMRWIESKVGWYSDGKIWDWVSPFDLLRFKPIPLTARLRVGVTAYYLQKQKDWHKYEGITAVEWLQKKVGRKGYEKIWEPMLRGKFGQAYDQVGMVWFWGKMATRVASRKGAFAKERLGYPACSFGQVFDTLGEQIQAKGGQVNCNSAVKRVVIEDGRAAGLEVEVTPGKAEARKYDAVIATTPSFIFTQLVQGLPKAYLDKLNSATYLSAVLAILVMDRPFTEKYWINIADRSIPFVALIEHTNFMPPSAYGNNHILYVSNYIGKESPFYTMPKEQVLDAYVPHLKKVNPAFDKSWIKEWHYWRENAAQPVIGTRYSQRIPELKTPVTGLYLANTTQIYPEDRGTNYSVRLGYQVADLMLKEQA